MARGRQKGQAVEKKKIVCVTIGEKYRCLIDDMQMTLEVLMKETWKPVGFFTQYEPMIKRIIHMETLNKTADKTINMKEYLDIMVNERKRIEKLFEEVR